MALRLQLWLDLPLSGQLSAEPKLGQFWEVPKVAAELRPHYSFAETGRENLAK